MYSALLSGQVDAVVFTAPALQCYAAHDGVGKVRTVGPEFKKGDVGFVVPPTAAGASERTSGW
jgi:ABC-type amino acid transport substrate-binding protein